MSNEADGDCTTQTRNYFLDPKHTKWQFAAFAKYCYNLPHFPSTSQNLRRQTAWTHWEHHLRSLAQGSDQAKKEKANDLLWRIQEKQQSAGANVNVQNFMINAIGSNTIHTGTEITTTTNLNSTNIVNNVGVGVGIKRESPLAGLSPPPEAKRKSEAEAEYAPWPSTPPLPRKRRQTTTQTTSTTPYTDAQLTQLRSVVPATNLPSQAVPSVRQRLILLQDKLTRLEYDRENQLARLRVQWVRFKEADRRMGEVVREVGEELGMIVEEKEVRDGDGMLTSRDETVLGEGSEEE